MLRRYTLAAEYERQLVTADDGGTIGLDFFRGAQAAASLPAGAPVLLVLHGVTGACCGSSGGDSCVRGCCHVPTASVGNVEDLRAPAAFKISSYARGLSCVCVPDKDDSEMHMCEAHDEDRQPATAQPNMLSAAS